MDILDDSLSRERFSSNRLDVVFEFRLAIAPTASIPSEIKSCAKKFNKLLNQQAQSSVAKRTRVVMELTRTKSMILFTSCLWRPTVHNMVIRVLA